MKNLTLSLLAFFTLTGLVSAQASNENRPPLPPQEVVEQFDLDGDGQLNEAERNTMRESRQGQRPTREQMLQRFDSDGDGRLNQSERDTARQARGQRGQRGQCRGGRGGGGR